MNPTEDTPTSKNWEEDREYYAGLDSLTNPTPYRNQPKQDDNQLREAIEKKFTDQFFASTESRNDIRRNEILALFTTAPQSPKTGAIPSQSDNYGAVQDDTCEFCGEPVVKQELERLQ